MHDLTKIRNFSIIAHIDHGKSTLADRIIQICNNISYAMDRILDSMDIEKERGISIKAQTVSLNYISKNGNTYLFNLVDTPGHIDFSYEVYRSLYACEGVILLIDSVKGIESQTMSVYYTARSRTLSIIPVLNKIDLPNTNINNIKNAINNLFSIKYEKILQISAKYGIGIVELLENIIINVPCPTGSINSPFKAIIFDSWFDNYLGIVMLIRIIDGCLKKGDQIWIQSINKSYTVIQVGIFKPNKTAISILKTGEIGYVISGIRNVNCPIVGKFISCNKNSIEKYISPNFSKINYQVYAGLFPVTNNSIESFRKAIEKLHLNDSSFSYEPEYSESLGLGYRCGFLGNLHMEIIKERLMREYKLDLIITIPTVNYKIVTENNKTIIINNPAKIKNFGKIKKILEPIARVNILAPEYYLGKIINLCINHRGIQINIYYINNKQVNIIYDIPMYEVIYNFSNSLQSITSGYATLNFYFIRFQESNLVKLDILINGKILDSLSTIIYKDVAYNIGNNIVNKLYMLIPKQMFDISIQASLGGKKRIIARKTIKAFRKNVTDKCYGGDITRKKKLLEKQNIGKKRMKKTGNISLPKEIFINIFKHR